MIVGYFDYINVVKEIIKNIETFASLPYSLVLYGSLSRGEINEGQSDIDLLYVLPYNKIKEDDYIRVHDMLRSLNNPYNIKIHLRLRGFDDLTKNSTGTFDCGFTSSINKLRDSIYLLGHNMDDLYFKTINDISIESLLNNIKQRLSKLRYDIRSLICINSEKIKITYIIESSIGILAELICYSKGLFFLNRRHAIKIALENSHSELFSIYKLCKQGNLCDSLIQRSIVLMDSISYDYFESINPIDVSNLKNIEFRETNFLKNAINSCDIHWGRFKIAKDLGLQLFKAPIINTNSLVINTHKL